MATTLTALFKNIADAIRTKTGKTGQIVAENFPAAISNIRTNPVRGKSTYSSEYTLVLPETIKPKEAVNIVFAFAPVQKSLGVDEISFVDLRSDAAFIVFHKGNGNFDTTFAYASLNTENNTITLTGDNKKKFNTDGYNTIWC